MSPEEQKYFEDRFDMFSTDGWKTFQDEVDVMIKDIEAQAFIGDDKAFLVYKGSRQLLLWLRNQEDIINTSYDNLVEEDNASI